MKTRQTRHTRQTRRPRHLAVLGALLLGTGVGAGAGLGAAGFPPSAASGPERAAPLPRPFGGVTAPAAGRAAAALHAENEKLVADCMRRRGFTYRPEPSGPGAERAEPNPYGLLGPAEAAADGYGVTGAALSAGELPDPNREPAADPKWHAALVGTEAHEEGVRMPDGSEFLLRSDACAVRADRTQYGPDHLRLSATFAVLGNRVVDEVEKDPRYLRAREHWSACMTEAGHPARELADPVTAIGEALDAAGADPGRVHAVAGRELEVARADARCQSRADLAAAVGAAQADAEQRVIGRHAGDLARLRDMNARALAAALAATRS
ncbi:hypothetical protein LG634_06400 [Streptomyces bambusae]|uniref:hypothetical protein n=1 Tax=Streptomyces bambusae TaxID=1550616 RepID=UPI001CFD969E|nr:hypothetical protein [Streptomyces bambusae]MCB5164466.1 hypothetical protein [Streptomyces bambusae]